MNFPANCEVVFVYFLASTQHVFQLAFSWLLVSSIVSTQWCDMELGLLHFNSSFNKQSQGYYGTYYKLKYTRVNLSLFWNFLNNRQHCRDGGNVFFFNCCYCTEKSRVWVNYAGILCHNHQNSLSENLLSVYTIYKLESKVSNH